MMARGSYDFALREVLKSEGGALRASNNSL
jgi:hypothetical protein